MSEKKSLNHYKNTEQISELCEYKFELPKFGESTTDPTYYEPQATRIANMRKSASNSVALYDFQGDNVKLADDINSVHVMIGRKPGMTNEEISQLAETNKNSILAQSKNAEKEFQLEKQATEKMINDVKATKQALNSEE